MTEEESHFREFLACHGSEISRWPEEIRHIGFQALLKPGLAGLLEEEKRFEHTLALRGMAAAPRELSSRIIARSLTRRQMGINWFSELRAEMKPAALAAMLALGFLIGFDMFTPTPHMHGSTVVSSTDDDGAIL